MYATLLPYFSSSPAPPATVRDKGCLGTSYVPGRWVGVASRAGILAPFATRHMAEGQTRALSPSFSPFCRSAESDTPLWEAQSEKGGGRRPHDSGADPCHDPQAQICFWLPVGKVGEGQGLHHHHSRSRSSAAICELERRLSSRQCYVATGKKNNYVDDGPALFLPLIADDLQYNPLVTDGLRVVHPQSGLQYSHAIKGTAQSERTDLQRGAPHWPRPAAFRNPHLRKQGGVRRSAGTERRRSGRGKRNKKKKNKKRKETICDTKKGATRPGMSRAG